MVRMQNWHYASLARFAMVRANIRAGELKI
jgi:hypothetical protein